MKVSDQPEEISGLMKPPQNFSVNDGAGIRTTLFLAGCPLRCQWCANPECIALDKKQGIASYSVEQVLSIIDKQKIFYRHSGGGVTFSGGEATLQRQFLDKLSLQLYDDGVDLALETSGYFNFEKVEAILKRMDLIFIDIKLMDNQQHKLFTGRGNRLILDNIKKIAQLGKNTEIVIRIPVIEGVNAYPENIRETALFVKQYLKKPKIELLPYHTLGHYKYEQLGLAQPSASFAIPLQSKMLSFEKMIQALAVEVVHY